MSSLNKSKLKNDLRSVVKELTALKDQGKSEDIIVNGLADAIENYIKSGVVQVTVQGISTAGSPSAQAQVAPVTAIGDPNGGTGGIS